MVSSIDELDSPSDAWAELVDRLDVEAVEVNEDSRVGDATLIALAMVFFSSS